MADQILKVLPMNGDTLAMKGLHLSSSGKKDEGIELVKKGIAMNSKSHITWHVYGLIHRSNVNYSMAVKCYQQALRIDPENTQILHDMATLQIHLRMYEQYAQSRRTLLTLKATDRINWLSYAVALHMSGSYKSAIAVIDSYLDTIGEEANKAEYGNSEVHLYYNLILRESGEHQQALDHLDRIKDIVKDRVTYVNSRIGLLRHLGRFEECAEDVEWLFARNPECYEHHMLLQELKGLTPAKGSSHTPEQVEKLVEMYKDLAEKYPKCLAVKRLPLDFLSGEAFRTAVTEYVRVPLRRGVPSLFRDLTALYDDADKKAIIMETMEVTVNNLRSDLRFDSSAEPNSEKPEALLWALYFVGNQYDHLQDYPKALAAVDEAIIHTPSTIDLFVLKARIFKHCGDFATAFFWMDHAREMDLADRYLNTKCVRYAHRAGHPEEANKLMNLFLRDEHQNTNIYDLQVQWFEASAANMYFKLGDYGRALKHIVATEDHYVEFVDDQFDFHRYCVLKSVLTSYTDMLRWADKVRGHRFYFRAVKILVKVCFLFSFSPSSFLSLFTIGLFVHVLWVSHFSVRIKIALYDG